MESPVSAFAVYRSNKSETKKKNRKKRNKNKEPAQPKTLAKEVNEDVAKKIGKKLKEKQKKKIEANSITKKKIHKKKKNRNDSCQKERKKKSKKSKNDVSERMAEINNQDSDSDNIPELTTSSEMYYVMPSSNLNDQDISGELSGSVSDESFEFTPVQTDSVEEGLKLFKWLIAPFDTKEFLNRIWEKKPLHIARKKPNYYKELVSTPAIDEMLRNHDIQFTKNLDVTSYVDGKRETLNPDGRAHPHIVWDFYLSGCSIRLLNPQTFMPNVHLLNATLQEYFTSFVGANVYLTPPDSQGFAPHYDDIEAFILQTEGKKHWRIYKPRSDKEILPRYSSPNFTEDEIGKPIMEVTLEAGDMLYFPRGYIHQAVTIDGEHSLHMTISMYQKHSWADMFEKILPAALHHAIKENVEFRQGLPLDISNHFGYSFGTTSSTRKTEIEKIADSLFKKIKAQLSIDYGVDQMQKQFQTNALPPVLTDLEKAVTVHGDVDVMTDNGKVVNRVELGLDTKIRLLRKNILRVIVENRVAMIIYHSENSLEYQGRELPMIEIDNNQARAVTTLIQSYPKYISVESLDLPGDAEKVEFADALWSRGLLMTEYPLENIDDE